jgi:hypothetical protein
MVEYALGTEGEKNFVVRQWAESIVRHVAPKDYLSEILALYGWATSPWLRYTNDAIHVEQVKTPYRTLLEVSKTGVSLVDCDDIAVVMAAMALSLGRRCQYVVVGFGHPDVFTHVFLRVQEPKTKEWIVLDPVAGTHDADMLRKVRNSKIVEVD